MGTVFLSNDYELRLTNICFTLKFLGVYLFHVCSVTLGKLLSLSGSPYWSELFVTPWTSPWNSPGQNTGVGSLSLLQGIFPTQVSLIAGGFFTSWATRVAHGPHIITCKKKLV